MNRIKSFLAAVMMLAALPVIPAMPVTAAGGYDGTYVIRNVHSGLFLHADGTAAGANVDQFAANAADGI